MELEPREALGVDRATSSEETSQLVSPPLPDPRFPLPRWSSFRITSLYAALAELWIPYSDRLLSFIANDPSRLTKLQTLKGWGFVAVTSILVYLLVYRQLRRYDQSQCGLQESELRFRELVENATHGVFRCTGDGVVLDVNPAFVELLGYDSKGDLMCRGPLGDIFHPSSERLVHGRP